MLMMMTTKRQTTIKMWTSSKKDDVKRANENTHFGGIASIPIDFFSFLVFCFSCTYQKRTWLFAVLPLTVKHFMCAARIHLICVKLYLIFIIYIPYILINFLDREVYWVQSRSKNFRYLTIQSIEMNATNRILEKITNLQYFKCIFSMWRNILNPSFFCYKMITNTIFLSAFCFVEI